MFTNLNLERITIIIKLNFLFCENVYDEVKLVNLLNFFKE